MRTLLLFIITIAPYALMAKGKTISKIVIDAGHGGTDIGAQGATSMEKDITLSVSLKLGKILADSIKVLQVIYTRTSDSYPSLSERHDIANRANADLFVAIHVNSTPYTFTRSLQGYRTVKRHHKILRQPYYHSVRHHETKRRGVEIYVLALHRSSQKESAISEVSEETGLLDENDPQSAIIVAQYLQAFQLKSLLLSNKIRAQFALQGRPVAEAKQLPLEVLAGSAMPGVLVEIGFITNPQEEAYLNSDYRQQEVAIAIFKGIVEYKTNMEK